MPTISTRHAVLHWEYVDEDDVSDIADEVGVGGIVITSLRSDKTGQASLLLARLIAEHPATPMGVIAYAESGDHARLYRLYGRFGFEGMWDCAPSGRVRRP